VRPRLWRFGGGAHFAPTLFAQRIVCLAAVPSSPDGLAMSKKVNARQA